MFTIESALNVESLRTLKLVSSLEMSCTVVIVVLKSMENNQMNQQEIKEAFEYASEEILQGYMLMSKDNGYLHFKHKLTREYIRIPTKESLYPKTNPTKERKIKWKNITV